MRERERGGRGREEREGKIKREGGRGEGRETGRQGKKSIPSPPIPSDTINKFLLSSDVEGESGGGKVEEDKSPTPTHTYTALNISLYNE